VHQPMVDHRTTLNNITQLPMVDYRTIFNNTACPPTADHRTTWNNVVRQPMADHRTPLNNTAHPQSVKLYRDLHVQMFVNSDVLSFGVKVPSHCVWENDALYLRCSPPDQAARQNWALRHAA
jgi:hypothetical protein